MKIPPNGSATLPVSLTPQEVGAFSMSIQISLEPAVGNVIGHKEQENAGETWQMRKCLLFLLFFAAKNKRE